MAELLTTQDMVDGRLDVKSLGEAANGDENTQVVTRTGETYPSAKKAIKAMFANGGLPATPFATKDLLNANTGSHPLGSYGLVTDDGTENGLYIRKGQGWAKSQYSPSAAAIDYANANPLFLPVRIQATDNLNNFVVSGEYHKIGSSDIDAVTNNYPVPLAGVLRVSATGGAIRQFYMPFTTKDTYTRVGATGAWTLSTVTQADILATINNNPMVFPADLSTSNLNDILTVGEYYQTSSGRADVANKNYPVASSGILRVSGYATSINQEYTDFASLMTYIRRKTSASFTTWKQVTVSEPPKPDRYYAPIEWQGSASTKVSYDSTTNKVTMTGLLVASFNVLVRNIRISGLDITINGTYDVCYLDLIALGSVTVIDASNYTNYIKVGTYEGGSYLPEVGKVPLFKYDALQGKAVACSGFPPIYSTSSGAVTTSLSPCYYSYTQSSLTLKVYTQIKDALYIGFDVVHQQYLDDIIYEDYWRITGASFYNLTSGVMVSNGKKALETGESEFVFKQNTNKDDFTGGYHGDEKVTDIKFLIGGVLTSFSANVSLTACNDVEFIQKSTMHETAEGGAFIVGHPVIALHTKRTSFFKGGYKTYNKVTWQYTGELYLVYSGISCISKDVANVVMTGQTLNHIAMTGSNSELFREIGAREYIGYNTTNGLSANATSRIINNTVADEAAMMFVTDRVPDSKYYRRAPVSSTVSIGDVTESEFICKFNSK